LASVFLMSTSVWGGRLRLHGRAEALTSLMATNWMKGLTDYARVSGIQSIPNGCQHRIVRRIQAKSVHNKRKRSVTKGWLSAEEAKSKIRDTQQKKLKMPYLQIKSLSNGNSMRVYIEHGDLVDTPASGAFNSYGLSSVATIPWF
jgi:CRISPR-associated endonuclease Csy4